MKVLVATRSTQGTRPSDENRCTEGELVFMLDPCLTSWLDLYGRKCACGRSFLGMSSLQSTTTARVIEVSGLTLEGYEQALAACFVAEGWCRDCFAREAPNMLDDLVGFSSALPVGAVVERRLDTLHVRRVGRLKGRAGGSDGRRVGTEG